MLRSFLTPLWIWLLAIASTPHLAADPGDPAAARGAELASDIAGRLPEQEFSADGVLRRREPPSRKSEVSLAMRTEIQDSYWASHYEASRPEGGSNVREQLRIVHRAGQPNEYWLQQGGTDAEPPKRLSGEGTMIPFGGSDFWVADLGLEFLHWPDQRLLKTEMRRSRACHVLQSTAQPGWKTGYSRVVSWMDVESGGVLIAEAYGADGNLLKEFSVKSLKKVAGRWQVQEMEIRNVRSGTQTRLELQFR